MNDAPEISGTTAAADVVAAVVSDKLATVATTFVDVLCDPLTVPRGGNGARALLRMARLTARREVPRTSVALEAPFDLVDCDDVPSMPSDLPDATSDDCTLSPPADARSVTSSAIATSPSSKTGAVKDAGGTSPSSSMDSLIQKFEFTVPRRA
jgi:hypothetical protein